MSSSTGKRLGIRKTNLRQDQTESRSLPPQPSAASARPLTAPFLRDPPKPLRAPCQGGLRSVPWRKLVRKPCWARGPRQPGERRARRFRQSGARPAKRKFVTDRKWAESDAASGAAWSTMGIVVGKKGKLWPRPEVWPLEPSRNVREGRGSARRQAQGSLGSVVQLA